MSTQPYIQEYAPKFKLGELVLYGNASVRVIGREQFIPGNIWFYLLGAKVGKSKMVWHSRIPEFELRKPEQDNLIHLFGG